MQNEIISKKLCVPPRITAKQTGTSADDNEIGVEIAMRFPLLNSSQNCNGTTVLSDHTSFLPVQRMLDFDFLCGWILWLPFLAFLSFTQQCRGDSEPAVLAVGAASRSEALKEEVLATSLLELNGFFTTYFPSEATRSI
ncbi:hypothetical protein HID58_081401, partial [Brassica napus]